MTEIRFNKKSVIYKMEVPEDHTFRDGLIHFFIKLIQSIVMTGVAATHVCRMVTLILPSY